MLLVALHLHHLFDAYAAPIASVELVVWSVSVQLAALHAGVRIASAYLTLEGWDALVAFDALAAHSKPDANYVPAT